MEKLAMNPPVPPAARAPKAPRTAAAGLLPYTRLVRAALDVASAQKAAAALCRLAGMSAADVLETMVRVSDLLQRLLDAFPRGYWLELRGERGRSAAGLMAVAVCPASTAPARLERLAVEHDGIVMERGRDLVTVRLARWKRRRKRETESMSRSSFAFGAPLLMGGPAPACRDNDVIGGA